jgi:hypothetical protein
MKSTFFLRVDILRRLHLGSWIQERLTVKAAKKGNCFSSSSVSESVFGRHRTNGSNASSSIALYFFRSHPNHPSHSAKARTRSLGTGDSTVRDDVSDGLTGSELYAVAKDLRRGNRGDTGFLCLDRRSGRSRRRF